MNHQCHDVIWYMMNTIAYSGITVQIVKTCLIFPVLERETAFKTLLEIQIDIALWWSAGKHCISVPASAREYRCIGVINVFIKMTSNGVENIP